MILPFFDESVWASKQAFVGLPTRRLLRFLFCRRFLSENCGTLCAHAALRVRNLLSLLPLCRSIWRAGTIQTRAGSVPQQSHHFGHEAVHHLGGSNPHPGARIRRHRTSARHAGDAVRDDGDHCPASYRSGPVLLFPSTIQTILAIGVRREAPEAGASKRRVGSFVSE